MTPAVLCLILLLTSQVVPSPTPQPALKLHGKAAEVFLREAEVIALEEYDTKGITKPRLATLTDCDLTAQAVFKTINELHTREKLSTGRIVFNLRDHYKHEIAAYELDKLLGLGFVPPTVERTIGRDRGSLQLWVEGAITEWERSKKLKLKAPDVSAWNNQMSTVKVFLQLIWDTDYNNISNILIDESWKIWVIDSSRAFRREPKLRKEASLTRFSRQLLESLQNLDRAQLGAALEPWLNTNQIEALWQRRNRILELAEERIAEFGEDVAVY
jgi:hypothetical protein